MTPLTPHRRLLSISGATSEAELQLIGAQFRRLLRDQRQLGAELSFTPAVGLLVSSNSLRGRGEDRRPRRYVPNDRIGSLFASRALPTGTLKICHYCSNDPSLFSMDWRAVRNLAGEGLDGWQINAIWPDPAAMQDLRTGEPEAYVILQVGSEALEPYLQQRDGASLYDTREIVRRLEAYAGLIDAVLLDPSRGRGIDLNAPLFAPLIATLSRTPLDLIVAGNLSAQTLPNLLPLMQLCPRLGTDTESAIRLDDGTDRCIDGRKLEDYLTACSLLYHA